MASKKKAAPRKRTSTSRSRRAALSRPSRFFRAFVVSSLTAFGAASCALHPEWSGEFAPDVILSQLGLPVSDPAPIVAPSGPRVQTKFVACPQFFPSNLPPVVPFDHALRELCFSSFAILHSGKAKTPVFVVQRLNRQILQRAQSIERKDRFYAEARLPQAERAELSDYRGSGYSRGHMAPAADMATEEAMAQSFSLANMVPQEQGHNGGAWATVEEDTRRYVMRARGDVFVFTGPVYQDRAITIGTGRVAVPSHLYKVVYDATTRRAWVHWQANSPKAQTARPITYEEFVKRTGLALLPEN